MTYKIIIDTDPGVDDAMAIFLALCSPELEVIGLTTIFGNVTTEMATTNALRLLEIAGRTDIPVAKGADDPLTGPFGGPVPFVHGDDGQGNIFLPPPTSHAVDQSAARFIVEQVMSHPGEVTLVPVGPLTNIALALRLEPRIAQQVREVVIMGGNALGPGNATPSAEANIHNDPEAADVVFGAPWSVTMVGLDVTHQVIISDTQLAEYGQMQNPLGQHIARIVPFYRDFFHSRSGIDGIYVHDSSAVAYLLDRSLFKTEAWPVRVDRTQDISRGKTWPSIGNTDHINLNPWRDRPRVTVCVGVDSARLIQMAMQRIREA
jgi:inosine-uridine nucleoside N-ribohydrolase